MADAPAPRPLLRTDELGRKAEDTVRAAPGKPLAACMRGFYELLPACQAPPQPGLTVAMHCAAG